MKKAVKALISGQVQGVGYRYFAQREAAQLGVTGYVRNRFDGRVEVFVQGETELVELFINILEQGPRFGHVERLQREETDPINKYDHFKIEF